MINLWGVKFKLYGVLIGVGIWLAWEMSLWAGKKLNISEKIMDEALWWVLIPGIIGARAYHVSYLWSFYSQEPMRIFKIWQGGVGIWGAVAGGLVGLILYWKLKVKGEVKILNLLDASVVGVPLAQSIGRWGNLANNELWGRVTDLPWGVVREGVKVHPLFLYESILSLALFGGLVYLIKNKTGQLKKGSLTGVYLLGYGVIRFLLEPLRPDHLIWRIGSLPLAQVWAMGAVVLGSLLLVFNGKIDDLV